MNRDDFNNIEANMFDQKASISIQDYLSSPTPSVRAKGTENKIMNVFILNIQTK